MPIRTLQNISPRLPHLGRLRKGAPSEIRKNKKGEDYQHVGQEKPFFRFSNPSRPDLEGLFNRTFGAEPQELTVYLPYPEKDQNLVAWMEIWGSGRLIQRCNGESVQMRWNKGRKAYDKFNDGDVPCDCSGACSPSAHLHVIIPEFFMNGHVGIVSLETGSKNDILELDATLTQYHNEMAQLVRTPFKLYRYEREIPTPEHGRQKKWLVGLTPEPQFIRTMIGQQSAPQLGAGSPKIALTGGEVQNHTEADNDEIWGDFEEDDNSQLPFDLGSRVWVQGKSESKRGIFNGISTSDPQKLTVTAGGHTFDVAPEKVSDDVEFNQLIEQVIEFGHDLMDEADFISWLDGVDLKTASYEMVRGVEQSLRSEVE